MLKIINTVLIVITFFLFSCKKNDSQTQGFLSTNVTSITLDGSIINAKDSFNIQSNVNWTISISPSSATWVSSSISNGNGNSKIYITTSEANTTAADRTATVTLSSPNNSSILSVTIQVTQSKFNNTIWSKLYGGSGNDQLNDIIKTSDGNYVFIGYALSNNGDLTINRGESDFWMAKVNNSGNIIWSKTMGGSSFDIGESVVESNDGGYIFVGQSSSNDGDVVSAYGRSDIWVVKLDANGNLVWKKSYGGTNYEDTRGKKTVTLASNGDILIVGNTQSNDGDVSGQHGNNSIMDIWVFRINSSGNLLWQKCFGGTKIDIGYGIAALSNNEFMITGLTESNDGDININKGESDAWAIKINATGGIIWQKTFGGMKKESFYVLQNTPDGGYLFTGYSESNDGDITGNHGATSGVTDALLIKTDFNGNIIWQKCFGGALIDILGDIAPTLTGGYMLVGGTSSFDGDVSGGYDKPDVWLLEINGQGNKIWQKPIGSNFFPDPFSHYEIGYRIITLPSNEYLMLGISTGNGDDLSNNHGSFDGWLYKFKK